MKLLETNFELIVVSEKKSDEDLMKQFSNEIRLRWYQR